jgi:hypothetical protein
MEFLKLGDTSHDFLQVLIPEFILSRRGKGVQIDIDLTDDLQTLKKSAEKLVVNEKYKNKKYKADFQKSLNTFYSQEEILSYRVHCDNYPLRHANGGVLPIIRLNNIDYFCFFYRCIFPVGWNIANGASNTLDDLINPAKIIHREFLEELFFFDHKKKLQYCLETNPDEFSTGTFKEALNLWQDKLGKVKLNSYTKQPLPMKWITGPDKIIVHRNEKNHPAEGIFVNITPDDNAIEIDRIAIINLKDNVALLDGEVDNILINRIIGLFKVEKVLKSLHKTSFTPDRIFFNGKEHLAGEMTSLLENSYFPAHRKAGIWNKKNDMFFNNVYTKYDLCPITRSLVTKYKTWITLPVEVDKIYPIFKDKIIKQDKFKVFISYKSEDTDTAFWLYDFLESKNIPAFCSGKSIPQMGESDYARIIDKALDKCSDLVVLGTKPEYFDSGWVSYEWRSFLNEVHSGRKPGGKVFTLTQEIPVSSLPYALRSVQNLPFSKNVLNESFTNLLLYISDK